MKRTKLTYAIAPLALIALISFGAVNSTASNLTSSLMLTDEVIENPDVMPEFNGGPAGLMSYLGANIQYPADAAANNESGTVYVSFVVKSDGSVIATNVEKGVSNLLDGEAKRVVANMPKWTPGEHQGKKVSVKMVLPVKFQLAE
jgi:TonB family protein